MPKPRIYSDEERKQRKKEYDIKYQRERYNNDEKFREMKKNSGKNVYNKKKDV